MSELLTSSDADVSISPRTVTADPNRAAATALPPNPLTPTGLPLWRMSVDRYERAAATGLLTPEDRVELLDGLLVQKMTDHPPHVFLTNLLAELIRGHVPAGWMIRIENPIRLSTSELEPDLAIVRGTFRDYRTRHPTPAETAVVIEVADSSSTTDRRKVHLYGRDGVPESIIVDIPSATIERFREPGPDGYTEQETVEQISLVIDGHPLPAIAAAELFGEWDGQPAERPAKTPTEGTE